MKDRLIELLKKAPLCNKDFDLQYSDGTIEKIADHILADGWIRPPCKVGDILYSIDNCINRPEIIFVTAIHQYEKYISITALSRSQKEYVYEEKDFGKYVFFTREEAEAKLKEGGEK